MCVGVCVFGTHIFLAIVTFNKFPWKAFFVYPAGNQTRLSNLAKTRAHPKVFN